MSIEVQTRDRVTLVTLSRPDVRNAVDADTARALHAAFVAFDQDANADVAVFQGAGGHFCAGWDLQSGARLQAQGASGEALAKSLHFTADQTHPLGPMGPSRLHLSKPVIAAIEGAAVAGGMELALWCDLRVMAQDAYMGVFCRRFGVPLIDGGTVRLPRLIGLSHALDLILTGRRVESAEALRMGLCNRVVPAGQALDAALALACEIASFPQDTLRADRASALAAEGLPLQAALLLEWAGGSECLGQALQGASRFASGQGRHGQLEDRFLDQNRRWSACLKHW